MKKTYWIIGGVILLIICWVFFITFQNKDTQKVVVFFTKSKPAQIITVGVDRDILASSNPEIRLQRTVNKLLLGPNNKEKNQGLYSAINPDVRLNSVNLTDQIATLDFNKALDFQVGGSAKVLAIREQLEKTAFQFDFINQLVLTINNGEREAILEP